MVIFNKAIDIIIKMMVPFVLLALMIGMARLFLDLVTVFKSSSIKEAFDMIVTSTLSMFVVIELLRSILDFFEKHRLRITFIIDAALVFILREIMIGLYSHSLGASNVAALALLLLALGIVRAIAIVYSPENVKGAD